MTLKLGDVVEIGGDTYVVGTVTGLPPAVWQLIRVPVGQKPLDLGVTWTRGETDALTLLAPQMPPPSQSLEPPVKPPAIGKDVSDGPNA